jgi:hypothetical protein
MKGDDNAAWWQLLGDAKANDDWDWLWGEALEHLQQFENPRTILALIAEGSPVPDWVRDEIKAWFLGERPPLPSIEEQTGDAKLLAAIRAFNDPTNRPRGESREHRLKRVAKEHGYLDEHGEVRPAFRNFAKGVGGTYRRLVGDWNKWHDRYIEQENLFLKQARDLRKNKK